MKKIQLDCYYVVSTFESHDRIKDQLLELIDREATFNINSKTTNIKTDWGSYDSRKRKYFTLIENDLKDHMSNVYAELGYPNSYMTNYWFQQYYKLGKHGWHTHLGCQWTSVYYLELPNGAPLTEIINPWSGEQFFLEAKEGDIVTFPSFVLHRAPEILSDCRKTIISFHGDAGLQQ